MASDPLVKNPHIVFLDAATLSPSVPMPRLDFPHRWNSYDCTPAAERIARIAECDMVITNKVVIDETVLQHCAKLKYIGVTATGYNNIDLQACRKRGVVVCNAVGYSTNAVAEHTLMFILALSKQLKHYCQSLAQGRWQNSDQFCYFHEPITSLCGRRLGLVGTGTIAQAVARLSQAFGMIVDYYSPSGREHVDGKPCLSFNDLLAQSDIVSVQCPLTDKTQHLFNQSAFLRMQKHALLINTARGPIVDSAALVDALTRATIAGAAVDVLPLEPPPESEPVLAALDLPQLLVTPHTAWASRDSQQRLLEQVFSQLRRFVAGQHVNNLAE